jgi:molybdopterin synthase catalytic subunit
MANFVCEVLVTDTALRPPDRHIAGAGGIVDFWGVVRGLEDGREIEGIDYEAHREMADHQLKRIAAHAAENFSLQLVVIHHRVGFIAVGEPSLFTRVASLHRQEAFQASEWIVNELKKRAPIWKKPLFKLARQSAAAFSPAATT